MNDERRTENRELGMTLRSPFLILRSSFIVRTALAFLSFVLALPLPAQTLDQKPNTWVKRSPLPGGPASPGMAYEASFGYDPVAKRVIRWAGHNQGGGGEQNAETWIFDPATAKWELKEPNL